LLQFVFLAKEIMFSSGQKLAVTSHLDKNVFFSYVRRDWCT